MGDFSALPCLPFCGQNRIEAGLFLGLIDFAGRKELNSTGRGTRPMKKPNVYEKKELALTIIGL